MFWTFRSQFQVDCAHFLPVPSFTQISMFAKRIMNVNIYPAGSQTIPLWSIRLTASSFKLWESTYKLLVRNFELAMLIVWRLTADASAVWTLFLSPVMLLATLTFVLKYCLNSDAFVQTLFLSTNHCFRYTTL